MCAFVPVCVVMRSARHVASAECRWSTPPPLLQLMGIDWAGAHSAALTFGHLGEMLVGRQLLGGLA